MLLFTEQVVLMTRFFFRPMRHIKKKHHLSGLSFGVYMCVCVLSVWRSVNLSVGVSEWYTWAGENIGCTCVDVILWMILWNALLLIWNIVIYSTRIWMYDTVIFISICFCLLFRDFLLSDVCLYVLDEMKPLLKAFDFLYSRARYKSNIFKCRTHLFKIVDHD